MTLHNCKSTSFHLVTFICSQVKGVTDAYKNKLILSINLKNHLLPAEETICHELPRPDSRAALTLKRKKQD